jgi:hypothetical protein
MSRSLVVLVTPSLPPKSRRGKSEREWFPGSFVDVQTGIGPRPRVFFPMLDSMVYAEFSNVYLDTTVS